MLRPKKSSYKEFDDEKKFLRLEITFFNGPSLIHFVIELSTPLFSSKEIKFQRDE